ncbi:hypothetical protein PCANB_001883 [Pneumocystis canis]|nr:hypothetical protein PCANB_001883 [Pneumocystis canis]
MSHYYDLDDILSENTKLPCIFQYTVPGLGYLEENYDTDIKEGNIIDLPFWLAEMLAISNFIDIGFPNTMSLRVRNALKACPQNVDLRTFSTHYYLFAEKILSLISDKEFTFKSRISLIADHAHTPHNALTEEIEFIRNLDDTERMFFRIGHDSAKSQQLI